MVTKASDDELQHSDGQDVMSREEGLDGKPKQRSRGNSKRSFWTNAQMHKTLRTSFNQSEVVRSALAAVLALSAVDFVLTSPHHDDEVIRHSFWCRGIQVELGC